MISWNTAAITTWLGMVCCAVLIALGHDGSILDVFLGLNGVSAIGTTALAYRASKSSSKSK